MFSDPKRAAKYFYISDMLCQLHKTVTTRFDERVQKLIANRYEELATTLNTHENKCVNDCLIESDDDKEVKEQKSKLAMQLIGNIKMY